MTLSPNDGYIMKRATIDILHLVLILILIWFFSNLQENLGKRGTKVEKKRKVFIHQDFSTDIKNSVLNRLIFIRKRVTDKDKIEKIKSQVSSKGRFK